MYTKKKRRPGNRPADTAEGESRHQRPEPGPGRRMGRVALRRRKARGTVVAGGGMAWGSRTTTTRRWRM